MYEMPHQHGNIFILLEGQKHFINDYQEHFNVIQKLNHTGKWVLATVRINLVRN